MKLQSQILHQIFHCISFLSFIFQIAGTLMSGKMGQRSVSHGGLTRGGGRMGRRTSMAF